MRFPTSGRFADKLLGHIEEAGARLSLVRRLERLVASKPDPVDVNMVAYALWRRRHPDLLPIVRRNLESLELPSPNCLHGLRILLEKPFEELRTWAQDPSVSLEHKTGVLAVLEEELPETLVLTLVSFISVAHAPQLCDVARKLIVATTPNRSLRATILFQFVGHAEDAALIKAHRPAEPILAEAFDDVARALRSRQKE